MLSDRPCLPSLDLMLHLQRCMRICSIHTFGNSNACVQAESNSWSKVKATTETELITIEQDGEVLDVRPAWISIRQEEADKPARSAEAS